MPEAREGRERYHVQVRATFRTMCMEGFRSLFVAYLQVMRRDGIRLGTHCMISSASFCNSASLKAIRKLELIPEWDNTRTVITREQSLFHCEIVLKFDTLNNYKKRGAVQASEQLLEWKNKMLGEARVVLAHLGQALTPDTAHFDRPRSDRDQVGVGLMFRRAPFPPPPERLEEFMVCFAFVVAPPEEFAVVREGPPDPRVAVGEVAEEVRVGLTSPLAITSNFKLPLTAAEDLRLGFCGFWVVPPVPHPFELPSNPLTMLARLPCPVPELSCDFL